MATQDSRPGCLDELKALGLGLIIGGLTLTSLRRAALEAAEVVDLERWCRC